MVLHTPLPSPMIRSPDFFIIHPNMLSSHNYLNFLHAHRTRFLTQKTASPMPMPRLSLSYLYSARCPTFRPRTVDEYTGVLDEKHSTRRSYGTALLTTKHRRDCRLDHSSFHCSDSRQRGSTRPMYRPLPTFKCTASSTARSWLFFATRCSAFFLLAQEREVHMPVGQVSFPRSRTQRLHFGVASGSCRAGRSLLRTVCEGPGPSSPSWSRSRCVPPVPPRCPRPPAYKHNSLSPLEHRCFCFTRCPAQHATLTVAPKSHDTELTSVRGCRWAYDSRRPPQREPSSAITWSSSHRASGTNVATCRRAPRQTARRSREYLCCLPPAAPQSRHSQCSLLAPWSFTRRTPNACALRLVKFKLGLLVKNI